MSKFHICIKINDQKRFFHFRNVLFFVICCTFVNISYQITKNTNRKILTNWTWTVNIHGKPMDFKIHDWINQVILWNLHLSVKGKNSILENEMKYLNNSFVTGLTEHLENHNSHRYLFLKSLISMCVSAIQLSQHLRAIPRPSRILISISARYSRRYAMWNSIADIHKIPKNCFTVQQPLQQNLIRNSFRYLPLSLLHPELVNLNIHTWWKGDWIILISYTGNFTS